MRNIITDKRAGKCGLNMQLTICFRFVICSLLTVYFKPTVFAKGKYMTSRQRGLRKFSYLLCFLVHAMLFQKKYWFYYGTLGICLQLHNI